jgi:simple sugar transport system ATP-binding protein
MPLVSDPAVHLAGVTKTFPGNVVANDNVTLAAAPGSIHAIVGENGAGKSTLMNILYGAVTPDAGRIRLSGTDALIRSPGDAIRLGIGMVTQHASQIPALSVVDNIMLGRERARLGVLNRRQAIRELDGVASVLGVSAPWQTRAGDLSVAALQKAEIVRAVYRGARVLILDEPTAALSPQETDALFGLLHRLADAGHTVLVVTHRLHEVMDHASRVTVLRRGRAVAEMETASTCAAEIAALMIGGRSPDRDGPHELALDDARPFSDPWAPAWPAAAESAPRMPVLEVEDVSLPQSRGRHALFGIDLAVRAGEIVGIAGVDGSGQRELGDVIMGIRRPSRGAVRIGGRDITRRPLAARLRGGVGFCPEDRQRDGLILDFTVAENLLLGHQWDACLGGGPVLDPACITRHAAAAMRDLDVRAPSPGVMARALSGGNQQKLLLARALGGSPQLLVAMQPTRGLDIHATRVVYDAINSACVAGLGVLIFSLDLDELLSISHRIDVMYAGRVVGSLPRSDATTEALGHMMTTGTCPA